MKFANKNEIAQTLRQHGIQPTSQRVEIANVLFENWGDQRVDHHLSADELL